MQEKGSTVSPETLLAASGRGSLRVRLPPGAVKGYAYRSLPGPVQEVRLRFALRVETPPVGRTQIAQLAFEPAMDAGTSRGFVFLEITAASALALVQQAGGAEVGRVVVPITLAPWQVLDLTFDRSAGKLFAGDAMKALASLPVNAAHGDLAEVRVGVSDAASRASGTTDLLYDEVVLWIRR